MSESVRILNLILRAKRGESSREFTEEVAIALGWSARKRTGLGLNGRTPGRWGWVPPDPPWEWKPRLPALLGPRQLDKTIAALAALAALTPSETPHVG